MAHGDIVELRAEVKSLARRVWLLEQEFRAGGLRPRPLDSHLEPAHPPTSGPAEPGAATEAPEPVSNPLLAALAARKSTVRTVPTAARPGAPEASDSVADGVASERVSAAPGPFAADARPHDGDTGSEDAGKRRPISLEWFVGGRVYAILGALVVIAGVGLFLKLAWDRGWFAVLPDAWKCILSAAFGAVLLGAGEVLRKRWGAIASIGCSAAGLGVIYASAYATYAAFGLVTHQVGFAMLGATALLGIVIGARSRLVSISIVSMLGAYLTPFFFLDVEPAPLVLPAYLIALLVTGLSLCARLGGRFVATRSIAWWGTVTLGGLWALSNIHSHPAMACGFLVIAWSAIQGELILSALRGGVAPGTMEPDARITRSLWSRARPFSVSFSTSAWAAFIGGVTMDRWHDAAWMATGAGFVATAMLGLWLAGHIRVLRDVPETDRERLGAVFVAQAGVFLIMTIALGLAGWVEVAAWIAMGAAAIVAGRWLRARPMDVYGIATLSLASLRLVLFDKVGTASLAVGTDVGGLFISRWSAMMTLCAAAWIATGELVRRTAPAGSGWRGGSVAMQLIGLGLLTVAPADELTHATSLAWLWLTMSAGAFLVGDVLRRAEWRWVGVTGAAVALMAGAAGYAMWDWTTIMAAPLWHGAWWFAIAIGAGFIMMGKRIANRTSSQDTRSMGLGVAVAGGVVLFLASTLEVARVVPQVTDTQAAQRAAVSIWWGLCAVAMLAAGFLRRNAPVRYVGLTLLGAATLKAVVFDLIGVSAGWRVASFVLLGVLMIGVAAVYTRVTQAFDAGDHSADDAVESAGATSADGAEATAGV